MSSSPSILHKSSYCTSHLFLHAFCNKIVKSAGILKYCLHEVTVLQWMGLFTPQTMVSFLISLHIQEITYVGYTWITLEVFHLKTQELQTFSLLVKAEIIKNNEEACIYNHSLLCQPAFLTPYMGYWEDTASWEKSVKKRKPNPKQTPNEVKAIYTFCWYRNIFIDARRSSASC